jgi:outer membrane usher protein PapC
VRTLANFKAPPYAVIYPIRAYSFRFHRRGLNTAIRTGCPSSRWDEGIPGLLLDYNLNASQRVQIRGGDSQNASISGTVGANAGPWRLRGDYQGSYSRTSGSDQGSQHNMDWSRVYMYRALPQLRSTLSMGENYLSSSIFDSWRYTGLSLSSDDRMLPPALRGYAPEVSGIAKTNAKVVVSQQDVCCMKNYVPSGPFRIQDLSSAVTGKLDVKVEEQDGTVQTFQVDTATIPYLTRPGMVRYKLAMGRPSTYEHHLQGPTFATGEFSWVSPTVGHCMAVAFLRVITTLHQSVLGVICSYWGRYPRMLPSRLPACLVKQNVRENLGV